MRRIPLIFTLWPGLPQLWLQGHWLGLLKAIGFAVLLNLVLFSTYAAPDLFPKFYLISGWLAVGLLWTLAIFRNEAAVSQFRSDRQRQVAEESNRLFVQAQKEYLQGNGADAERLLQTVIHLDPLDLDARMYLATISRRRGRFHHARNHLKAIEDNGKTTKWHFEIADEYLLIEESEAELAKTREQEKNQQKINTDPEADDKSTETGANVPEMSLGQAYSKKWSEASKVDDSIEVTRSQKSAA